MSSSGTGKVASNGSNINDLRTSIEQVANMLRRQCPLGHMAYRHLEKARWHLEDALSSTRFGTIRHLDRGFEALNTAILLSDDKVQTDLQSSELEASVG